MNESPNKRAVMVGIFISLGILFLIGGILTIGNIHGTFTKKMNVVAVFDNVNGLQAGGNVWFSGVKIGTVKKLNFFGRSEVKVTLNLNKNTQDYIRKDAKVKISTDGLIGNKILEIYGGTARADAVSEGDTLAVEKSLSTEEMMSTFQANNKNVLEITNDLKFISKNLANGNGTIGKMLKDETVYNNISATTASLQSASNKAAKMMTAMSEFSSKLNKKGTLANELVTDTQVFKSVRASVYQLNKIADSASAVVNNMKRASENTKTPVGVLLHDEQAGANLKATLKNLESGSAKLDEDLEALQHNFLLKGYFKKQAKMKAK